MRSLKIRTHEWLADHISWVQYPELEIPELPTHQQRLATLNRRALWITAAIFLVFGGGGAILGAISGLLEPRVAPVPARQPGGDSPAKPRLNVLTGTDSSRA